MSSDTLKLYITPEHPCSYLDQQQTRSLFVEPSLKVTGDLYSQLNEMGFRRSGKYVYKPKCDSCQACQSARVRVQDFKPSRSHKRILKRNRHLQVKLLSIDQARAAYPLYERYIEGRHRDGDMYPPSAAQYESFLLETLDSTRFIGFFDGATLVCVAVVDGVNNGLSALYTFYEPSLAKQALGVHAILWQIGQCQHQSLDYLYLGYWIENCAKMNYKQAYQPLELRIDGQWCDFSADYRA